MNNRNRVRIFNACLLIGFGCMALSVAGLLAFGSFRNVVLRFVHDDAFYYFQIARNLEEGRGFSFDGITSTNGFHPLWLILVRPLAVLHDQETFARACSILSLVYLVAGTWIVYKTLGAEGNRWRSVAVGWAGATLLWATIYGMESGAVILSLAAVIYLFARFARLLEHRAEAPGSLTYLVLGLACSMLILSRIDTLPWVAGIYLGLILEFRQRKHPWHRAILLFMVPQVVLCGGYLMWSWWLWGNPLPISARIKAARAGWFSLNIPLSLLALISIATLPVSLWGAIWSRKHRWLGLGNLAFMLAVFMKGGRESYNWYFVPVVFSMTALLPEALQRWSRIPLKLRALGTAMICLGLLALSIRGKLTKPSSFAESYDLALTLNAIHGSGHLIFAGTDCGILGFFSGHPWVNLDGLTADDGLQVALRDDRLPEWLEEKGVNAILVQVPGNQPAPDQIPVYAHPGIYHVGRRANATVEAIRALNEGWGLAQVQSFRHP